MSGGDKAPDDRPVRARRGDVRAFESLVEEHQAIAFRTALVITGSAADAEEAAHEAFVRAWLALRRFRRGASFWGEAEPTTEGPKPAPPSFDGVASSASSTVAPRLAVIATARS